MNDFQKYVSILLLGIFAVMLLYVVALSVPGFLIQSSNPSTIRANLIVQGVVYLTINGNEVLLGAGSYGTCTISNLTSNCLRTGTSATTTTYGFGFILLEIVAIFFFCILILYFAVLALRKSRE